MPQVTAMPKIELPELKYLQPAQYESWLRKVDDPDWYEHRYRDSKDRAMVSAIRELRAALSELSELRNASDGWVSVRDSMPEKDARVDVWCVWPLTGKGSRIPDARYAADSIGAYWTGAMGHIAESVITHWRSFPEPPQPLPASAVEEKKV